MMHAGGTGLPEADDGAERLPGVAIAPGACAAAGSETNRPAITSARQTCARREKLQSCMISVPFPAGMLFGLIALFSVRSRASARHPGPLPPSRGQCNHELATQG